MMMDNNSPVTEDELNAYVDGELPADRRGAVEAWLAGHPDDAARVAAWRVQIEAVRERYGPTVDEPVPERLKLERLTGRGRSWAAIAAAATIVAFLLGGAAGWLARGASAAAPSGFDLFTAEALDAYKLYVVEVRHPVEVPGAERAHLVQWLSKRVGYEIRAPNLEPMGLKLVGGRLLPGPTGASAFFMYEGGSGERFTLYCAHGNDAQTQMRYRGGEQTAAFYWADRDLIYVMSGPSQRDKLQQVARAAYDQLDSHTTNGKS
jgi:anti-sigma factor RsiW